MVPDFRLQMPHPTGGNMFQLAEHRLVSCCETWYTPSAGGNMRATDRRATGLQGEYRRKAKAVDKEIAAQRTQERGPIETRIDC